MRYKPFLQKLRRYHQKLNGTVIEYDLTSYRETSALIRKKALELKSKTDSELKELSAHLKMKAVGWTGLNELMTDAYALVTETITRVLHMDPFDEQIIGAIVLHEGKCSQMQTGEGKTLTAVYPAYLNALSGKGVHILTFNDYLAHRDCQWMGPVYEFLGLKTGCIQEGMIVKERQKAYRADITYCTAKEAGFDFLRDSIVSDKNSIVHRNLNFAIIDEADSIMIDEARIPLVIAGKDTAKTINQYKLAQEIAKLREEKDYEYDEYRRNVFLTEEGLNHLESVLGCGNLYSEDNGEILTDINYALHAAFLLHADKDYIVREGKVELVDEFTGRIACKRRWPDGLQEAVEAKEGCAIQEKGKILNSITLQNFLTLYPGLSGMTATAQESQEEFRVFYGLPIVIIPPHNKCIRKDNSDLVFRTREEKLNTLVNDIKTLHATGQPLLIGTGSVGESHSLFEHLKREGIDCSVLNAKHDSSEAQIISEAGKRGAVTISTNMAGRGTDIKLGGAQEKCRDSVVNSGGLYVIGTNRHESRRIDNQLRGRAGRQGDPGLSRFYISLQDDIFIRYRLHELLPCGFFADPKDLSINNPILLKEIDRIQRIVEGQNLDIKINLHKYSLIIEQQRKIIHNQRNGFLLSNESAIYFRSILPEKLNGPEESGTQNRLLSLCKRIALYHIDSQWSMYLREMNDLKDSIHLRRIGGQDPLFEFRKIAIQMFDKMRRRQIG